MMIQQNLVFDQRKMARSEMSEIVTTLAEVEVSRGNEAKFNEVAV